jgi:hypothetical protein
MIDLKAKAEKYESKTAQCKEWARQATDGHQRNFYEELAGYYSHVAEDFRQVIAKRGMADRRRTSERRVVNISPNLGSPPVSPGFAAMSSSGNRFCELVEVPRALGVVCHSYFPASP